MVAEIWIEGTKYEGHGNNSEEAFAALDKGWKQRCEFATNRDPNYITEHAHLVKYSDA